MGFRLSEKVRPTTSEADTSSLCKHTCTCILGHVCAHHTDTHNMYHTDMQWSTGFQASKETKAQEEGSGVGTSQRGRGVCHIAAVRSWVLRRDKSSATSWQVDPSLFSHLKETLLASKVGAEAGD